MYKYDLDTKVEVKEDKTITVITDEDEELEVVLTKGDKGVIESCGRSSTYNFKAMYDVTFEDGSEVTFFQNDLEEIFNIVPTE